MKKLIVDAGSTKVDWVILEEGQVAQRFATGGYNPNYAEPGRLDDLLYKELPGDLPAVDAVYYYGSGCKLKAAREKIAQALRTRFKDVKEVRVTHDLMAVCHAVLGHEQGIACILGTGANSCRYDGREVTDQAVSLGYLVGDEGSGCYIGRKLVRAYFYDWMPYEVKLQFDDCYHLTINDFINNTYHQPQASRYLAGFTRFAGEHQDHPFIRQLVKDCFREFVEVFVLRYPDCHEAPVCFVGSVAYHFQELLGECLSDEGLTMGKVMQSPMEGLIRYHGLD